MSTWGDSVLCTHDVGVTYLWNDSQSHDKVYVIVFHYQTSGAGVMTYWGRRGGPYHSNSPISGGFYSTAERVYDTTVRVKQQRGYRAIRELDRPENDWVLDAAAPWNLQFPELLEGRPADVTGGTETYRHRPVEKTPAEALRMGLAPGGMEEGYPRATADSTTGIFFAAGASLTDVEFAVDLRYRQDAEYIPFSPKGQSPVRYPVTGLYIGKGSAVRGWVVWRSRWRVDHTSPENTVWEDESYEDRHRSRIMILGEAGGMEGMLPKWEASPVTATIQLNEAGSYCSATFPMSKFTFDFDMGRYSPEGEYMSAGELFRVNQRRSRKIQLV